MAQTVTLRRRRPAATAPASGRGPGVAASVAHKFAPLPAPRTWLDAWSSSFVRTPHATPVRVQNATLQVYDDAIVWHVQLHATAYQDAYILLQGQMALPALRDSCSITAMMVPMSQRVAFTSSSLATSAAVSGGMVAQLTRSLLQTWVHLWAGEDWTAVLD